MASRKNVIFIGMTQNGKSSLVQQILRYAGEFEKASTVGIGHGNFSETQKCSIYDAQLPLKTHHLRQIDGPNQEKNGEYIEPGNDFELEDEGDFTFAEDVEDSGQQLQLSLIDTPGLSDSGNSESSKSDMRVIDERHKLRILLALQNVEELHAVCFIVRRDTNYGGDFQALVKRMVSLLKFCIPSTAWNLQYHIIHTNIDVDDRKDGLCEIREQDFDDFGPASAVHHFLDNKPDPDFPLDIFFTNNGLSNLFKALSSSTPVKVSDLRYPKSQEQIDNDKRLLSAAQNAVSEMQEMMDERQEEIDSFTEEVQRHQNSISQSQKRIDDYDLRIAELDRGDHCEIDKHEAWTDVNVFGNGERRFSMHTQIPIAKVETSCHGGGFWRNANQEERHYYVELQAWWLQAAHGTVTIYATKREKHSAEILELDAERRLIVSQRERFQIKLNNAEQRIAEERYQLADLQELVRLLKQDATMIQNCRNSLSLSQYKDTIKFLTVDSPLAAAKAYEVHARVPWSIPSLKRLNRSEMRSKIEAVINDIHKVNEDCASDGEKAVHMERGAQAMLESLASDAGLPVGVFASWIKARGFDHEDPFLALLPEFAEVSKLAGVDLNE